MARQPSKTATSTAALDTAFNQLRAARGDAKENTAQRNLATRNYHIEACRLFADKTSGFEPRDMLNKLYQSDLTEEEIKEGKSLDFSDLSQTWQQRQSDWNVIATASRVDGGFAKLEAAWPLSNDGKVTLSKEQFLSVARLVASKDTRDGRVIADVVKTASKNAAAAKRIANNPNKASADDLLREMKKLAGAFILRFGDHPMADAALTIARHKIADNGDAAEEKTAA